MAGSNRDEFSGKVKNALALRANYRCSFPDCPSPTSGPSEESPDAVVKIGVAAHICAASPGGPRYLEAMTPAERSSASNGIWLCPTHSTLIDRDPVAYAADVLREMKRAHERRVSEELRGLTRSAPDADLVAIGSDMVFIGELLGVKHGDWQLRIDHFLVGELATLTAFGERFDRLDPNDRYVLINSLGDGRQLAGAPSWRKTNVGYVVSCSVRHSFPRTSAHSLPTDISLNSENDVFVTDGRIATISGLEALPQRIKTCLSVQRSERFRQSMVGVRIKEYYDLFRDSPWLPRLIKLEVIRHACIPVSDPMPTREHTALMSVLRVHSVEMLPTDPLGDWLPFRFRLDVEGVGPWEGNIALFIPRDDRSNGAG